MARNWVCKLAVCGLLAAGSAPAWADEADINSAARAIEQKASIGQFAEAWDDLTKLQSLIWEKRPLGTSAALFVTAPAKGYGLYEPRENSNFKAGDPIYVYIQPVGYGYERIDDQFRISLTADFELRTPGGQVLAEQEAFSRLSLESRVPNKEFQTSFSFTFDGLDAGRYILLIRIRDENGGQRTEVTMPFSVIASDATEPEN